jgi:hypothetical protein
MKLWKQKDKTEEILKELDRLMSKMASTETYIEYLRLRERFDGR